MSNFTQSGCISAQESFPEQPAVPDNIADVTDAWLKQLLRHHHGSSGYELVRAERGAAASAGQTVVCSNISAVTCRGRLTSGAADLTDAIITDHLVVKLLPEDATMRQMITSLGLSQCETHVYADLLPKLIEFEASRGCSFVRDMTVACMYARTMKSDGSDDAGDYDGGVASNDDEDFAYAADRIVSKDKTPNIGDRANTTPSVVSSTSDSLTAADHKENVHWRCAVVTEDLRATGFVLASSSEGQLTESVLPAAVCQLARLAATSAAWLRHTGTYRLPYVNDTRLTPDHPVAAFYRTGVSHVEPALRRNGNVPLLLKLRRLEPAVTRLIAQGLEVRDGLRVVTHGDFKTDNLLMRRIGNQRCCSSTEAWEVRAIDWQACMVSHPTVDLIYLLMMSLPRSAMRRCESASVNTYFQAFQECSRALGTAGENKLRLEQLEEDFRRAKLLGLMWCLSSVVLWDLREGWPEHCIDIAEEVDKLGMLDGHQLQ